MENPFAIFSRKSFLLILVLSIATFSLCGWIVGKTTWASVSIFYIPTAPLTSVLFILLSTALLFAKQDRNSKWLQICINILLSSIILCCCLVIADYLFDFKYDIENIFIKNPSKTNGIPQGRISPISAFLFISTSINLLFFYKQKAVGMKRIGYYISSFILTVSFVLCIGYLYRAPLLYGSRIIPVALPTAICFLLIGLYFILVQGFPFGQTGQNTIKYQLSKSFLPLVIAIIILQGFLNTICIRSIQNPSLIASLILFVSILISILVISKNASLIGAKITKTEELLKEKNDEYESVNEEMRQTNEELFDAKEKLEASEKEFRLLAEAMPQIVWITRADGYNIYFNQRWVEYTGLSLEESYGDGWNIPFHPEDKQMAWSAWLKAVEKRGDYSLECRLRRKDGIYRWWLIRGVPVFHENTNEYKWFGTCTDINDIKQFEDETIAAKMRAEESEYFLRESQKAGAVGSYSTNFTTGYWKSSETLDQIFGIDQNYVRSVAGWLDVVHPDDRAMMGEYLTKEVIDERKTFAKEYRILRVNDKQTRWVQGFGDSKFDENGNIVSLIGTIQDITDRKIMDQELKAAKEKAEENDRLKTAFLHNMSHEIRTPLNAIIGFSEMLAEYDLDQKKRKHFTSIIQNSSNQLLSIVSNILTISFLETKQTKTNISIVQLNNLMRELEESFSVQTGAKNIALSAICTLPDQQSEIYSDQSKLVQILSNLLGNAVKFSHAGKIEFSYLQKGKMLEFYVKDTGIGIQAEMRNRIFERFMQANETIQTNYGGTGLGLTIAKAFVELLNGHIWMESEEGKGSTFRFTIPYTPVHEQASSQPTIAQIHQSTWVLVAEDEEFNFRFIEAFLKSMKLNVIHSRNGYEAVMECQAKPEIALVLMDIKMPILNGYEATIQIKEFRPDLPIIAQTAYALESDIEKYIKVFDDYMIKPLKAADLRQKLFKYIGAR